MNSYKNINFEEYGDKDQSIVMLLHGTFLSVWNYEEMIDDLKDHYHVILPYLDGHAGAAAPFESIHECAKKLLDFVDEYCHGQIALIGGLSLGGQIVLEMLSMRNDLSDYAVIESTSSWAKRFSFKHFSPAAFIKYQPAHLNKKQRRQYRTDFMKMAPDDLKKIVQATESYEASPALRDLKTRVFIETGSYERGLLGESEDLHHLIDHSQMLLMYRYEYGDFSLKHASSYVNLIEKLLHRVV